MTGTIIARRRFIGNDVRMENVDTAIAVLTDHQAAEAAIKKLTSAGFEMKSPSVAGKGYHTEEKVAGFYTIGDRVKFWGKRGAFRGLFLSGLFMSVAVVGHVVVAGISPRSRSWGSRMPFRSVG